MNKNLSRGIAVVAILVVLLAVLYYLSTGGPGKTGPNPATAPGPSAATAPAQSTLPANPGPSTPRPAH